MAENTTSAAFSDTTGENSRALIEKVIAIPDQTNANNTTPPAESARYWRFNQIQAIKATLSSEAMAEDPEHLATIIANHAERAQLEAKEAAVQARYARRVQARHSDASERLAAEQSDQGLPTDSSSETDENSIALNESVPEKPTPAVNHPSLEPAPINQAKPSPSQGIPEAIASRYLRIDDRYFMPDKTIAFEDLGNKLTLKTENHTVIRDVLAIAEARGWQSITVSGSQHFMHQAWREALLKGLAVTGYKPSALEVAELNHARLLRDTRHPGSDTTKSVTETAQQPGDGSLRGILLDHGEAHYRHDPKQNRSYFVTIDVDGKVMTQWGADFKRAFAQSTSQPEIGDAIVLSNTGQKEVKITSTARQSDGNPTDDKITVKKNTWQVEKAEYQDAIEKSAEALRVGQEIERRVIDQMPQLAAALAVSKLGEKIAQKAKENGVLKSQDEVDTMVYLIREGLAAALEKGKPIKTPEIQAQGQRAAVDANSMVNDHQPPELIKAPQDRAMTR